MKLALFLPIALASLSGCIPAAENAEAGQNPPELAGSCDASGLAYAVGKTLTQELETKLKKEAKASMVRVAPHDGVITMDYSPARLNIFTDEASKIIRINCG
ncbi:I78 family peptidase inhibitor [uncultured Sphingorhabdus sp.]|uniref:I78 family peptidase inhibitor n=1 Tax=uncultured Sphingorhabdus sp. TaxID=1686106 RepID=UPI002610CB79|nr:I78 family peptidase inhibitor [uncultured Sphingorhabdus sp.]HMS19595.1 I78 family peptidase inhibitor [Sphingorhabdus sp.]